MFAVPGKAIVFEEVANEHDGLENDQGHADHDGKERDCGVEHPHSLVAVKERTIVNRGL